MAEAAASGLPARVVAFHVSDMIGSRSAGAVANAVKSLDRAAVVHIDLATLTIEIEPGKANARELSDAIKQAGYSPEAA